MTVVLLIRHAQAAFGEDDYDRLCDRGVAQAKVLGAHLVREKRSVAAALSGALRRHQETAANTLAAMNAELPVTVDPRFDEYQSDGLLKAYLPIAERRFPQLATARASIRADRRLFQLALSTVMELWLSGADGFHGESWCEFQARVRAGLEAAVIGREKADLVAVFTSGGVIAAALAQVLALAPKAILDLHWRIANCSVTELNFGRSGFALSGFNMTAHLRIAGTDTLLTYR